MDFGFETLGLHRIEARFMKGNAASLRVMEKLGMTFEGYHVDEIYVKGEFIPWLPTRSPFTSAKKVSPSL